MKLDIGCGVRKQEGYVGVDIRPFDGVDHVFDAGTQVWPFEPDSCDEVRASHFVEHLTALQRIHFVNEAYRVLKPEGKLHIICPYAFSARAYGDLTHQWPPVTEWWSLYLNKEWRIDQKNAPHNDFYTCDFIGQSNFAMHPQIAQRHPEYQQFAVQFFKEATQDIIITLFARKGAQDASK